jgi:hypothetical protein
MAQLFQLFRRRPTLGAALLAVVSTSYSLAAEIPATVEVAVQPEAPLGAMQRWAAILSEAGLTRVRIRGSHAGDQPSIEPSGEGAAREYLILALVDRREELVLPDARFAPGDREGIRRYFAELAHREQEKRIERGPFGLTRPQFTALVDDLSPPLDSTTVDASPSDVLRSLSSQLKTAIEVEPGARKLLTLAKPLAQELKGLSRGTALAAALRTAGLALLPELASDGETMLLRVAATAESPLTWPVGWNPERSPRVEAPAMYRVTTVEIEGYSLAAALRALRGPMAVPLVLDQWKLDQRGIDPATIKVKLPRGKTYIRRAVDSILSQGRLAGELRLDDGGRPFYWITQWGKDSVRAR